MAIQVGDKVPEATMKVMGEKGPQFNVDDAQAAVAESNSFADKKTFTIRTAMCQCRRHFSDGFKISVRNYTGNSTHI